MKLIDIKALLSDWLGKEKQKIEEDKKRRYLHFDARIKNVGRKLVSEVSSPDYVVGRFFYPFIRDIQITRRYKKENGKKIIDKKERPLCYASHKDAFIFSWYGYILSYLYEAKVKRLNISENAIAYRSYLGKNNARFAREVYDFIKKKDNCAVLCFDIVSFFDSLNHKILKNSWKQLLDEAGLLENGGMPKDHFAVYKASTKYSFAVKKNIFKYFGINKANIKTFDKICSQSDFQNIVRKVGLIRKHDEEKGVPQGLAVSSVLSNAYMIDFDLVVASYIKELGGLYRRYSDDIIIVCDLSNYKDAEEFVKAEIAKLKLEIQSSKTEIRLFSTDKFGRKICTDENGNKAKLQYLGIKTDGNNDELRGKTTSKFYRKLTWKTKKEAQRSRKSKNKIATKRIYKQVIYSDNRKFLDYAKMVGRELNSDNIKKQFSGENVAKIIRRKVNKVAKKK